MDRRLAAIIIFLAFTFLSPLSRGAEVTPMVVRVGVDPIPRPPPPLIWAARGPGEGRTALAVGGRLFLLTGGDIIPVPTFAFDLAFGASDVTDLVLHASTIGVLSFAEAGAKIRLLEGVLQVAALVEAVGLLSLSGAAGGFLPGLALTYPGSPGDAVMTFGLDAPLIVGKSGFSSLDRSIILRPSYTLEFGQLYLRLEAYVPTTLHHLAPTAAFGYAW